MAGTYDKARAVFLAALMVVSVFGGSMAFAGTAAAAASSADLDKQHVQSVDNVVVSGTTDSSFNSSENSLYVVADANGDGTYNKSTEESVLVNVTNINDDGSFEQEFAVSGTDGGLGLEAGDVANIYVTQGEPADSESNFDTQAGTLTVDDTSPTAENPEPVNTTVSDSTPRIFVDLNESETSINRSTTEVEITSVESGEQLFYRLDATEAYGIWFEDGYDELLVIDIGDSKLDELPDGEIQVSVDAEDQAGNSLKGNHTFSFTVDTSPVTASITQAPEKGTTVTDANQTIKADVSSTSANLSDAKVTITTTEGTHSFDIDSGAFTEGDNATEGSFTIEAGPDGNISALPEGDVTVAVSATDKDGETDSETRSFEVDTNGPVVESLDLDEEWVNREKADAGVNGTIEFNEPVDPDSVTGGIHLDDDAESDIALADVITTTENSSVVNFTFDPSPDGDISTQGEVYDSGDANVTVNTATDDHGLSSDSLDASVEFDIDTENPVINEEDDLPTHDGNVVLSGVVDFNGSYSASKAEGGSLVFEIQPGQEGEYVDLSAYDATHDFDTTLLDEGTHNFRVSLTDDSENTVTNVTTVHVDNADPSLSYDEDATLTGEVNISEFLTVNNNGVGDVEYKYIYSADENFGDDSYVTADSFNVNNVGEGYYKLAADVEDHGYDGADNTVTNETVVLEGEQLDLVGDGFTLSSNNESGTVTVNVTTDVKLTGLNVTLETNDDFRTQDSSNFTLDNFEHVESADGNNKYTYTTNARDGEHKATFLNATADAQYLEGEVTDTTTVDAENASVVDADLVGANESSTTIRVEFSEPVSSLGSATYGGENVVDNKNADSSLAQGYATVVLDDEYQTGGDRKIAFSSITDTNSSTNENESETSADVTYSLHLSQGQNVVSIPAETGYVDLTQQDLAEKGIVSVWAYDSAGSDDSENYTDEWATYVVGEEDDEFQNFEYMEGGDGYVVIAEHETELDFEVENTPMTGQMSYEQLEAGWNLVGAYQAGSQNVDQAFSGLTDHVWSVQEGYSGDQPASLEGGQGYWLSVNKDATYVPVDYVGATSERPNVYNVTVTDSSSGDSDDLVSGSENVVVTAQVEHDSILEGVYVDASEVSGNDRVEMTDEDGDGIYTATIESANLNDINNEEKSLLVSAVDIDSNIGYGSDSVTVDNVAPTVSNYQVTNPDGQTVQVSFDSNEQLSTISVTGGDDASGTTLTESNFTETGDADNGYTYTAELSSGSDGTFSATLDSAVDAAGNDGANSESDSVTVDTAVSVSSISATSSGDTINVTVTGDEAFKTGSISVADVDNQSASSFSEVGNTSDSTYEYAANISGVSDGSYSVNVTNVEDQNGNAVDPTEGDAANVTVETAPDATSLEIVDTGSDGAAEEIRITYNENVSASNPEVGDYTLNGTNSSSYSLENASVTDDTVTITVNDTTGDSSIDTDLTISYNASAGNADSITDGTTAADSFDGKSLTVA